MAMHWPWQHEDDDTRTVPRQRDTDTDRRAEDAELQVRDLEKRADRLRRERGEDVWTQAVRRIIEGD